MDHLVLPSDTESPRCARCGSLRLRRLVSRISIAGGKAVDDAALRSRPRDFLDRPERFGEAMRAVSERTGVKLSGERVDGAMHRLSEAKKHR